MKTSCSTSTNKSSDEVLVAATKRGDSRAFEELVLRHRQKVLAVAQRVTNHREDAEDVAWLKRARTKPLRYRPLEDYLADRNRR